MPQRISHTPTDAPSAPSLEEAWAAFRRRWLVLQAAAWVLAWPLVAALRIASHPRPDPVRSLAAATVALFGGALWASLLAAVTGPWTGTG